MDENKLSVLMRSGVNLRQVEPHIYSVYPEGERKHFYDDRAAAYDRLVSSRLYNRLMWGYRRTEFASFCQEGLASSGEGWVLDAGCGSLVFTARTYADYIERPVVLLDQSIVMLRRAKERLEKLTGVISSSKVFLQGDILELPFKPRCFKTVISMNVLHVLEDAKGMIAELENAVAEGGRVYVSSLVAERALGNTYLDFLHRVGEVAFPRTAEQVLAAFENTPIRHRVEGNMVFVYCG